MTASGFFTVYEKKHQHCWSAYPAWICRLFAAGLNVIDRTISTGRCQRNHGNVVAPTLSFAELGKRIYFFNDIVAHSTYVLWQTPKCTYLFRQLCSLSDTPIVSWLECNVCLCLFLISPFVSFCMIVGYTALLSFTSRSSLCWCLLSPSHLSSTYFLSNRRQGNSVYFGMLAAGGFFGVLSYHSCLYGECRVIANRKWKHLHHT